MHILQLHTRYREPGGEDAVVDAEAALLTAAGHRVTAVSAENPTAAAPAAAAVLRAPWNTTSAGRVRAAVHAARPDVVHVHNTWFALSPAAVAAAAGTGTPVVATLHNYRTTCASALLFRDGHPCEDCVGSHPWHGVQHACYRGSRVQSAAAATTIALARRRGTWDRHVDAFLALTPFARQRFVAAGLPADRLHVRPHVVPDPGPRSAPPSASRDLVVLGRLSPEKGLRVVLEAIERSSGGHLRLLVVGDGPQRGELERLAGPSTTFLGRLDPAAVRTLLLSARALLFPSQWYETFGLSMVEAMAAGLPVIASDLGGSPWILGPDAGRVVPADDVEAWSGALSALADDRYVDERGRAARLRWHSTYRPEVGLRSLEAIYDVAVDASRERARR